MTDFFDTTALPWRARRSTISRDVLYRNVQLRFFNTWVWIGKIRSTPTPLSFTNCVNRMPSTFTFNSTFKNLEYVHGYLRPFACLWTVSPGRNDGISVRSWPSVKLWINGFICSPIFVNLEESSSALDKLYFCASITQDIVCKFLKK